MPTDLKFQFSSETNAQPQKPQFLKVLCILSIVACSLLIIAYGFGTLCLGISAETANQIWEKIIATQPQLESVDPLVFLHQIGMFCLYSLIANIVSLIGVILMWRLNKIGFHLYCAAELASNFLGLGMNLNGSETKSYGGLIFWIIIDIVFIVMYAMNLKYMTTNKSQNPNI